MTEWKEYKLGDVCSRLSSGKGIKSDFITTQGKYPVWGGNGVRGYTNTSNFSGRCCIIGRQGAYCGNVHFFEGDAYMTEHAVVAVGNELADSYFLACLLSLMHLENLSAQSAQPGISVKTLSNQIVSLPPLETQRRIASILSSLDDKIDLLHRENATLEQMAETLFRQWFVVEAKEEWEEKPLGKCIKLVGGGTPKTSEERFWNGNVCWLSGGDIANNHKNYVSSSEKSISEDGLNNSSAKLLPENAMVVSARGTVGKYCLLSKPMAFSQSNYGILPIYSNCYFFTYLLVAYHIDELQSAAYGSVFDTITTKTFEGVSVLLPKETGYIVEFEKMIEPYFSKMKYNNKQIQTLIQTRYGLLPRLMGGEVKS